MAAQSSRRARSERERTERSTSVVGSKVGESTGRLQGRRLPRGGIREQGGLSVAEGALPDSTTIGKGDVAQAGGRVLRVIAIVSGTLLLLVIIVAVTFAILSRTSAFAIESIEAQDTEHVLADDIARLASVDEGTTLLNVDEAAISDAVKKNPWVSSVSIERVFPSTLRIIVRERVPKALVIMGSGGVCWLLGDDGAWIEPVSLQVADNESMRDVALKEASAYGADLITDVPMEISPVAGSATSDESVLSVLSFEEEFSKAFADSVVSYSAPTSDDVSCMLESGVEVSLGAPTNVSTKEQVVAKILEEYGGRVTYINVRVPSRPTYRYLDSPYVTQGTGAMGESAVETQEKTRTQLMDEQKAESEEEGQTQGEDQSQIGNEYEDDSTDTTSDYGYDYSNDYDYTYGYDEGYSY